VNLPVPVNPSDLSVLLQEYTLFALPNLLNTQAANVNPSTCRLSVGGLTVSQKNPPASGAFSVADAANTAAGITWYTGDAGRKGWAITYLPCCPHDFVDDTYILSAEGWGNIDDAATNFKTQLESLPSYPPKTLVMGTLWRERAGAPRAASVFRPFVFWAPTPKVVTIRRRIPSGSRVSPF
jgi:hypothetical protein